MDTFRTRFTCVPAVVLEGPYRLNEILWSAGKRSNQPSKLVVASRLKPGPDQPAPLKTILRRELILLQLGALSV